MFMWHLAMPVTIPLLAEVARTFCVSQIMRYFRSKEYNLLLFASEHKVTMKKGVKFRPC